MKCYNLRASIDILLSGLCALFVTLNLRAVLADTSCDGGDAFDTSQTYSPPGTTLICLRCPRGYSRLPDTHCKNQSSTDHCKCCPAGHFQDEFVSEVTECAECRVCRQKQTEQRSCSAAHDRQCVCIEGLYYVPKTDSCVPHTKCDKGYGVRAKGTPTRNTDCIKCTDNETFSNVTSESEKCQRCSECPGTTVISQACSPEADTVCGQKQGDLQIGLGVAVSLALVILGLIVGSLVCRWRRRKPERSDSVGEKEPISDSEEVSEKTDSRRTPKGRSDEEIWRKMFQYISKNSGKDWKIFIRNLELWRGTSVDAVIERNEYENKTLPDVIVGCLNEYQMQCDMTPTEFVGSIPEEFNGLKEKLMEIIKAADSTDC